MIKVILDKYKNIDLALKKLNKEADKDGVFTIKYYIPPTKKRKLKAEMSRLRRLREEKIAAREKRASAKNSLFRGE